MRHTRRWAEVSACLTGGASSLQQQAPLSSGRLQGQLIEGDHLAAGVQDALARSAGYVEGAHSHFRDLQEPRVVCNGANHHHGGVGLFGDAEEARHPLQRHGRTVRPAHEQPLQHDAVELLVGAPLQEAVQLKDKPSA